MSDITIPPEAVEAVRTWMKAPMLSDEWISAMLIAALSAWPGVWHIKAVDFEGKIILPIPTENTNAET